MKLILATNNQHKLREIREILSKISIEILSLKDLKLDIEIVEDADTIEGNALKKAQTIYELTKIPTIADDTGLMVEHLNGAPGVYSARYAGEGCTYDDNNKKLIKELSQYPKPWKAVFVCCICLYSEKIKEFFIGKCEGQIVEEPKGINGFGYDPIFLPDGFNKTYAELSPEEKNKISHRAKAVRLMYEYLSSDNNFQKLHSL